MNRFFTLLFAASCLTAVGQVTYPYNPDGNADGLITVIDLQDLLSAYGLPFEALASEWSCGLPFEFQGYDYSTVNIGGQCWFAENLRSENYSNGDEIPSNLGALEWDATTSGAVTVYGEDGTCYDYSPETLACNPDSALDEYGRLYNWYAVDDARLLCPFGWHVSSKEDWQSMETSLGCYEIAGVQLKSKTGWAEPQQYGPFPMACSNELGGNGLNNSGFSGLPGGWRENEPLYGYGFNKAGQDGCWWTSSTYNAGSFPTSWFRALSNSSSSVGGYNIGRLEYGLSVRCVRDAE